MITRILIAFAFVFGLFGQEGNLPNTIMSGEKWATRAEAEASLDKVMGVGFSKGAILSKELNKMFPSSMVKQTPAFAPLAPPPSEIQSSFNETVVAMLNSAPAKIWLLKEQKLSPQAAEWEKKYGYRVYPIGMRPGPFHPLLPALLKRMFGTNIPFGVLDAEGTILEIAMIPDRGNRFMSLVRKSVRVSTVTMGMRNDHERFFNTEIAPVIADLNAKLNSGDPAVLTSLNSLIKVASDGTKTMTGIESNRLEENLTRMSEGAAPQTSSRLTQKKK